MALIRLSAVVGFVLLFGACGNASLPSKKATFIIVDKSERMMWLLNDGQIIKEFNISLGFQAIGHKQFEGDGKTPEGIYIIDRRNPDSNFHLSLGISYPNEKDRAYAASKGKDPGGDIFIHGESSRNIDKTDWTAGCIAVMDEEIELIYQMVPDGTVIDIRP